jgi:hypothetical protein
MCIHALDDLSRCCGAAIERRYYKFSGVPCHPDEADYRDLVCSECGKPCDTVKEKS